MISALKVTPDTIIPFLYGRYCGWSEFSNITWTISQTDNIIYSALGKLWIARHY